MPSPRSTSITIPATAICGRGPAKLPYRDAVVEVDDIVGRLTKTPRTPGRPTTRSASSCPTTALEEDSVSGLRLYAVQVGQGYDLGRRRARAGDRLLAGQIKPGRISDGLFDIMDLFNTSLAFAGIENHDPDGTVYRRREPDEASAHGRRRHLPPALCSPTTRPISRRCATELQGLFHGRMPYEQPFSNISMSTFAPVGAAPWIFDIYRDPQGAPHPEQRRLRMDLRAHSPDARRLTQ